jgi:hypothetical protein
VRGNGVHSVASLREDGYVPMGFMAPHKVKGIEDTRRARMPQHVIDAFRDRKAKQWAQMVAEESGDTEEDVNFATAEVLAKCADDAEQIHRNKVWAKAKRIMPELKKTTDKRLEKVTGMKPELLRSHRTT